MGELQTSFDVYPGVEKLTVEIDSYGVADGKYFYFDLPFAPSLFPGGTDHRSLPYYISWQNEETIRTTIDLPPGFRRIVIAPEDQNLAAPAGGGIARVKSQDTPGRRVITHELDVSPAVVSPAQYASLQDLESTLGRKSAKVFLLEKD